MHILYKFKTISVVVAVVVVVAAVVVRHSMHSSIVSTVVAFAQSCFSCFLVFDELLQVYVLCLAFLTGPRRRHGRLRRGQKITTRTSPGYNGK